MTIHTFEKFAHPKNYGPKFALSPVLVNENNASAFIQAHDKEKALYDWFYNDRAWVQTNFRSRRYKGLIPVAPARYAISDKTVAYSARPLLCGVGYCVTVKDRRYYAASTDDVIRILLETYQSHNLYVYRKSAEVAVPISFDVAYSLYHGVVPDELRRDLLAIYPDIVDVSGEPCLVVLVKNTIYPIYGEDTSLWRCVAALATTSLERAMYYLARGQDGRQNLISVIAGRLSVFEICKKALLDGDISYKDFIAAIFSQY